MDYRICRSMPSQVCYVSAAIEERGFGIPSTVVSESLQGATVSN